MIKKILIAAVTIDGKITKDISETVNWTSKKDKEFFREQTKKAGVVIFGSKTYHAIGHPMPNRLNIIMTRAPQKYKKEHTPGLLEFTNQDPKSIIHHLENRGFTEVVIGGGSGVYTLFLKEKLIDEMYLTIAPKIFGKGIPLFSDIEIDEINAQLTEIAPLGKDEALLKYALYY